MTSSLNTPCSSLVNSYPDYTAKMTDIKENLMANKSCFMTEILELKKEISTLHLAISQDTCLNYVSKKRIMIIV